MCHTNDMKEGINHEYLPLPSASTNETIVCRPTSFILQLLIQLSVSKNNRRRGYIQTFTVLKYSVLVRIANGSNGWWDSIYARGKVNNNKVIIA